MRWKTSSYYEPKHLDERIVTRFIWIPEDICGVTYWLEYVTYVEQYQVPQCYGYVGGWFPIGLVEREK